MCISVIRKRDERIKYGRVLFDWPVKNIICQRRYPLTYTYDFLGSVRKSLLILCAHLQATMLPDDGFHLKTINFDTNATSGRVAYAVPEAIDRNGLCVLTLLLQRKF